MINIYHETNKKFTNLLEVKNIFKPSWNNEVLEIIQVSHWLKVIPH